jgi:hypothetical protein
MLVLFEDGRVFFRGNSANYATGVQGSFNGLVQIPQYAIPPNIEGIACSNQSSIVWSTEGILYATGSHNFGQTAMGLNSGNQPGFRPLEFLFYEMVAETRWAPSVYNPATGLYDLTVVNLEAIYQPNTNLPGIETQYYFYHWYHYGMGPTYYNCSILTIESIPERIQNAFSCPHVHMIQGCEHPDGSPVWHDFTSDPTAMARIPFAQEPGWCRGGHHDKTFTQADLNHITRVDFTYLSLNNWALVANDMKPEVSRNLIWIPPHPRDTPYIIRIFVKRTVIV